MTTSLTWTSERVFHEGDSFYTAMLEEISRAQASVDLETYIFEDDELGRRVISHLAQAADRGVRIRLLVDGVGTPFWPGKLELPPGPGFQTRVFHPIPWFWRYWTLHPARVASSFKRMFRHLARINRRNHRKVCLIDGRVAYVGSMNVSQCHVPSLAGDKAWRDTGSRVEGNAISQLTHAFNWAWSEAREPHTRAVWVRKRRLRDITGLVRLNYAHPLRRHHYLGFLHRISLARERVWLTNPYFVPDHSLVRALRLAAWSGVDVRLLVPRKSDVPAVRWVTMAFYKDLLKGGVRVFEYLPRILHAKVAIVDEWAIVGSSNLNHRSLIHDLEIDVVLALPESRDSLERQFVADLLESEEISLSRWYKMSLWQRVLGRIGYYVRYYL